MAFQKVAPHKIMKFANFKKGGIGIHWNTLRPVWKILQMFSLLLVDEVSVFLKVLTEISDYFFVLKKNHKMLVAG